MVIYDDYDLTGHEDTGQRQQPILTPAEQRYWYWAEKEFWYIYKLMMPGWLTHKHNDMYI